MAKGKKKTTEKPVVFFYAAQGPTLAQWKEQKKQVRGKEYGQDQV